MSLFRECLLNEMTECDANFTSNIDKILSAEVYSCGKPSYVLQDMVDCSNGKCTSSGVRLVSGVFVFVPLAVRFLF